MGGNKLSTKKTLESIKSFEIGKIGRRKTDVYR